LLFEFKITFPAFFPCGSKPLLRRRHFLGGGVNQPDLARPQLIGYPDNQLADN
jgi:hypothetical protein